MRQKAPRSIVREIMTEFADLTGLSSTMKVPRRYLWTDAFAVCNFLELYSQTREENYLDLALRLIDQVHDVLGRHREDDRRSGRISGLDETEGKKHPTKGGLRIGKKMNERKPGDLYDERLEWERDGQYYHYLTKWMHALNRAGRVTGDSTYRMWAVELAKTAHAKFTYVPSSSGQKRLYWKMSIDLSYPLVSSMGQHDPLDGFVTYNQLQATSAKDSQKPMPDLSAQISDMAEICKGKNWATDDPLGMGGLLCDAYKIMQLIINEDFEQGGLVEDLLDACLLGLESYAKNDPLNLPADYRLAFRELGLAIGLHAVEKIRGLISKIPGLFDDKYLLHLRIENLLGYCRLKEIIAGFWLEDKNRQASTWIEHRDINMVMLATSLAPDGYLTL